MNVYITTENNYFFFGIKGNIKNDNASITRLNICKFESAYHESQDDDVFIIDGLAYSLMVLSMFAIRHADRKLIFFIKDKSVNTSFSFKGSIYLNSISDISKYFPEILGERMQNPPEMKVKIRLTKMEKLVLDYLVNGEIIHSMSCILSISIGSVYVHTKA